MYQGVGPTNGLTYESVAIADLINKDTDQDGLLDWEEGLWGTDPTKAETTPGTPDSIVIEKLKGEQANSVEQGESLLNSGEKENLTETDMFSRELFSTVATLSQAGSLDEATIEKITSSLAERMQNSAPRKVFTSADIKIINDESFQAIKNYNYALRDIYTKFQTKEGAVKVLQEFTADGNTVNLDALKKLDPIIEQTNKILAGIAQTPVPQTLSLLHLNLLNSLERLNENYSDIRLYDTDVIVSLSAMIQYGQNTVILETAASNLTKAIKQKWQN